MSATGVHSIDSSITRTNSWLADLADGLGTDDRRLAFRIARAWLHTVRDHLTVDVAAAFGAPLTEVLRGVYYEGWDPGHMSARSTAAEFATRFALDARIREDQVPVAASVVTAVARRHMSPGSVDRVLALLAPPVRAILEPQPVTLIAELGE